MQELAVLHVHGVSSAAVQKHVSLPLKDGLGFGEEVVVTPQSGFLTKARPDFIFGLHPGRGVLAEVERGGTVTNNRDLKDLWMTHPAPDAQHLVLVVPVNEQMARRVSGRLRSLRSGSAPSSEPHGGRSMC